ncbi:MAG: hypothetical protein H3C31_11105 [Brumimicrobium sp.]|nr:hypothetical protein [Brumimicrobium sp.]
MYQIPTSNQVSFRVSDYEKSVINEYLTSLEKDHNVEASNFRDVLLKIVEIHKAQEDELKALTDEVSSLSQALAAEKANKPRPETVEVEKSIEVLPNDLSEKFAEIRQVEFEGEEISELEILESILEANHSANEANKLLTLQIEKLVILNIL